MRYEGAGASTRKKRTKVDVLHRKDVAVHKFGSSESSDEMSLHNSDSDPPLEMNASDKDFSEEETTTRSHIRPVATHQSDISGTATNPISEVTTNILPF